MVILIQAAVKVVHEVVASSEMQEAFLGVVEVGKLVVGKVAGFLVEPEEVTAVNWLQGVVLSPQ